jgi:hypothetical protein
MFEQLSGKQLLAAKNERKKIKPTGGRFGPTLAAHSFSLQDMTKVDECLLQTQKCWHQEWQHMFMVNALSQHRQQNQSTLPNPIATATKMHPKSSPGTNLDVRTAASKLTVATLTLLLGTASSPH